MNGYGIHIDEAACWGCRTCEVACMQEFDLAAGVRLITVNEDGPAADDHPQELIYRVHLCRHCDQPPCAAVCPEDAIEEREDGIVVLDDELCSGCRLCLDACPYDAIVFDDQVTMIVQQAVALRVSPEDIVARIVFAAALGGSEEDGVIVHLGTERPCIGIVVSLLHEQQAGLGACVRLEGVHIQPHYRYEAALSGDELPDVRIGGVVEATLRQDNRHSPTGLQELQVPLDE